MKTLEEFWFSDVSKGFRNTAFRNLEISSLLIFLVQLVLILSEHGAFM